MPLVPGPGAQVSSEHQGAARLGPPAEAGVVVAAGASSQPAGRPEWWEGQSGLKSGLSGFDRYCLGFFYQC